MAQPYVKQEWADNVTVINKARLDHIEEGIYQVSIVQPEKGDPGKDGITPQFRVADDYIQVSTDSGQSYSNLVPLASITGPQGETGQAFSIYKTYPSVDAMNEDAGNVPEGSFVLIASTEDDPDNAKLYVKGADAFTYLSDLSGAQGIQGEPGKDGAPGVTPVITFHVKTLAAGEDATVEQSGSAEAPSVTIGVPQGADGTNGQNGSDGVNGKDGVTFTPAVDENANLSWTNDGGRENPPTVSLVPDLSSYVKYQEFVAGASDETRKTIQLANHDNLSGIDSTGEGCNLIMLSKWDKVDVGTTKRQMNLNSPDGIVQINDEKVVATTDQIPSTEGLATTEELTQGLAGKQPVGDYALKSEIPDVSDLATKEEVSQVEAKIPSIEGLATTEQLAQKADASTVATLASDVNNIGNVIIPEMNTNTANALAGKVDWDQEKKVISLPKDGSISAMRGDPVEGTQPEGGNLLAQRTYDEGVTYVTEVGTTKNGLTLNATERPQIDLKDADSEKVAYLSEIEAIQDLLPAVVNIPIRTLNDEVYDQAAIFGWFKVEDLVDLKNLFASQRLIWLRYGINSSGVGNTNYRFIVEYAEVNADNNTVKLVFSGLNTHNDKLAKYEFTAKLDGTVVSGNSNVQLTVTDQEA